MKEVKVYKIDAARRQTDQTIKLFFSEQDEISIHTLACAAHEILSNLVGQENSISLYDGLIKGAPKDRKKEVKNKLNQAKNFFKHADKDPEGNIIFRPENNDFMLFDNTQLYEQHTGEMTDLMKIFRLWFKLKQDVHPEISLPDLTASINNKLVFFEKARRIIDNMFLNSPANSE